MKLISRAQGQAARRPAHRHKFTLGRDHRVTVEGRVIGKVEQRERLWYPLSKAGKDLRKKGYRRAGDAASIVYVQHLKDDDGTTSTQLPLFKTKKSKAAAKAKSKAKQDKRSPQFQSRERINLCAEWYQHHEGKSRRQAFAMCTRMEKQGQLRADGSYISARGRKAAASVEEIATRMLGSYRTPKKAREAAWDHAMDHPRGSEGRAHWTEVAGEIASRSGLTPPSDGSAGLKKGNRAKDPETGRVLVYRDTGKLVKIGDETFDNRDNPVMVSDIVAPKNAWSTGRVILVGVGPDQRGYEYYPGVIGAEWRSFEALPGGRRTYPARVPRALWDDAVAKTKVWVAAGKPDEGSIYAEVRAAIDMCTTKMDGRHFDDVLAQAESHAYYGF